MNTPSRWIAMAALVTAASLPSAPARAGSCPECTSSSDCGPNGFCVRHNNPVGCGTRVQLCCPGQGCAVMNGRPSCEAAGTCTVVSGSGDAGAADVPVTPSDVAGDASASADGGPVVESRGGCACRATGGPTPTGAASLALCALGAIVIASRRRRAAQRRG